MCDKLTTAPIPIPLCHSSGGGREHGSEVQEEGKVVKCFKTWFIFHYPALILIGNKWNWFTQIKPILPMTVTNNWPLPVLISPQEPFVIFPFPCPAEEGLWWAMWHPARGRMNKTPAGSLQDLYSSLLRCPVRWPQLYPEASHLPEPLHLDLVGRNPLPAVFPELVSPGGCWAGIPELSMTALIMQHSSTLPEMTQASKTAKERGNVHRQERERETPHSGCCWVPEET